MDVLSELTSSGLCSVSKSCPNQYVLWFVAYRTTTTSSFTAVILVWSWLLLQASGLQEASGLQRQTATVNISDLLWSEMQGAFIFQGQHGEKNKNPKNTSPLWFEPPKPRYVSKTVSHCIGIQDLAVDRPFSKGFSEPVLIFPSYLLSLSPPPLSSPTSSQQSQVEVERVKKHATFSPC